MGLGVLGLRWTSVTGHQLRDFPDQRLGFAWLRAYETSLERGTKTENSGVIEKNISKFSAAQTKIYALRQRHIKT